MYGKLTKQVGHKNERLEKLVRSQPEPGILPTSKEPVNHIWSSRTD